MKRLSINDIAKANFRTGKRAYIGLSVGIFLSVFLVTALVMAVQGVRLANDRKQAELVGYVDFILFDAPEYTDQTVKESGLYGQLGHVYVSAAVTGTQQYIGRYDAEAEKLLNRQFVEGRMPEHSGEIAIERSALELLAPGKKAGDVLKLSMTPLDGAAEEREFIITGVMTEQSKRFEKSSDGSVMTDRVRVFPTILLHESELAFATGRMVVHRIADAAAGSSLHEIMTRWDEKREAKGLYYGVFDSETVLGWAQNPLHMSDSEMLEVSVIVLCALALLIASGVAISQAMESRLSQKREEIGMLRAVGATRRQIRRIFGREAWIIALILSPLSIAAGCAAVWEMAKIVPEKIVFQAEVRLLIPVLLFSVICILLSANLPLRRASKIMPMSVIRDVEMLRKVRNVKSRDKFKPARLISQRQLVLHPIRQAGAAALIAMMLICVFYTVGYFIPEMDETIGYRYMGRNISEEPSAFEISRPSLPDGVDYHALMPKARLTRQDAAQIAALKGVREVQADYEQMVYQLADLSGYASYEELPSYVRYVAEHGNGSANEPIRIEFGDTGLPYGPEYYDHFMRGLKQLRKALDIQESVIAYDMKIMSEAEVRALSKYAVQGKVDVAAVNAGEQVLIYAPDYYVNVYPMRFNMGFDYTIYPGEEPEEGSRRYENDWFRAGDRVRLMQMYSFTDEMNGRRDATVVYRNAHRAEVQPVIGAVLQGAVMKGYKAGWPWIITTDQGAEALGFCAGAPKLSIYLEEDVDTATEEYILERVETIAMRGEGATFTNNLTALRERRKEQSMVLLTFGMMTFVFLVVAISIVSNNVRRRIHADTRMIGTLRAVGADKRVLVNCYNGQLLMSILTGFAAALVMYLSFVGYMEIKNYYWLDMPSDMPETLLAMVAFCVICYGCCRLALGRSVQRVVNKSIIDNIREV